MIDEPDAHLEILRQKQVYIVLKEAAEVTYCQILIATHSEVILDESVDTNLTCIVNGLVSNLSSASAMKTTLRSLGVQHYYNAMISERLLITEGRTDVEMLRAFACKLQHPVAEILKRRILTYYTQTQESESGVEMFSQLEQESTNGVHFRRYHSILKSLVPTLRAVAILDGDGKLHKSEDNALELKVVYWKRYELENYFVTPCRLMQFVRKEIGEKEGDLFAVSDSCQSDIKTAMNETLKVCVFNGDESKVEEYWSLSLGMQESFLQDKKMSAFAEEFFEQFAKIHHSPILLNKGGYYRLIDLMEPQEISPEIVETLDLISRTLT